MRQLEVQLIIRPPVNLLILARASSGEGRVHDREIHVWGGIAGCRPPSSTRHPARRDDHHYFSGFKHLRRGWWAMRSPVICSQSAVAIRARNSAPRSVQANHLLLGGWGRRPGEQLPKAATSAENADSPAFSLVKRQFSAPGRIRTRDRLLRRQRWSSAVVSREEPASGQVAQERYPHNYLLSHYGTRL